jgi:GNAT superfamily N-acetyltransferase
MGAMIRRARIEDADVAADLVTQLGYPTTPEEMAERFAHLLNDASYAAFVAESEGHVVGLVGTRIGRYFEKNGDYAQILILVVSTTAHNTGAGSALVAAAEEWAREQKAIDIIVNSGRQREDAHRFYQRRGFEWTGLRFKKPLATK